MTAAGVDSAAALRITEIFLSLQGETSRSGLPTVFVRLTGCPLRCQYCDTAYAFSGGEQVAVADLVDQVTGFGVRQVTVTGGEPLAQPAVLPLMTALCDAGLAVSIETSGALDVKTIDPRVARVIDLKTPGSHESGRNLYANLEDLRATDEIKFVLCDRSDYEWARMTCETHQLFAGPAQVLFSPSTNQLAAQDLANWIVADRLPVRFQLQLHKLLWDDEPGR